MKCLLVIDCPRKAIVPAILQIRTGGTFFFLYFISFFLRSHSSHERNLFLKRGERQNTWFRSFFFALFSVFFLSGFSPTAHFFTAVFSAFSRKSYSTPIPFSLAFSGFSIFWEITFSYRGQKEKFRLFPFASKNICPLCASDV